MASDDQETRSNHCSYELRTGTKTQESLPTKIENHQHRKTVERRWFERRPCPDKWKDVLKTLDHGEARWDDSEKTEVPLLEDYKKKSLAHRNEHGGSMPTLLHELAARTITIRDNLDGDTILKIIQYLLQNRTKPTNDPKSCEIDEEPILRVALRCNNIEFINWIKKASETLEDFEELIAATDSRKRNCLHYCFNTLLPFLSGTVRSSRDLAISESLEPNASSENLSAIQLIKAFIVAAKTETIIAQDQHGNTPLHYALDYETFRLIPDLHESFAKMLINKSTEAFKQSPAKQFNKDNESPYLYFRKTRAKASLRKQSTTISSGSANTPFALNMGESEATVPNDVRKHIASMSNEPNENRQENAINRPKQVPIAGDEEEVSQTDDFSASSDVPIPTPTPSISQDDSSYSSAASPTSIYFDVELQDGSLELEAHADSIEEYLKIDYIRTRSEKEAKKLLYGKIASGKSISIPENSYWTFCSLLSIKDGMVLWLLMLELFFTVTQADFVTFLDKNLFLDASHLKGESVDQVIQLIDRLSRAGGFEDTLSYVRIPVLSVSNNKPRALQSDIRGHTRNSSHEIEGNRMERMDLVRVFDKLASENVRRILGLFIEDGVSSHSDAAIERAIQGRCSIEIDGDSTRAVALEVECWYAMAVLIF